MPSEYIRNLGSKYVDVQCVLGVHKKSMQCAEVQCALKVHNKLGQHK